MIVPATLKLIASLPVPAAQPFVVVMVFAAVIASRKAQIPGAPGSASELTTIVAARAEVLTVVARNRNSETDTVRIRSMISPTSASATSEEDDLLFKRNKPS